MQDQCCLSVHVPTTSQARLRAQVHHRLVSYEPDVSARFGRMQALGGFLEAALRGASTPEAFKQQRMVGGLLQPTLDAIFASATLQVSDVSSSQLSDMS